METDNKTETGRKIKAIAIPMDEKLRDELWQKALEAAAKSNSNPSAMLRDALLEYYGIEQKSKPRNYVRSMSSKIAE